MIIDPLLDDISIVRQHYLPSIHKIDLSYVNIDQK